MMAEFFPMHVPSMHGIFKDIPVPSDSYLNRHLFPYFCINCTVPVQRTHSDPSSVLVVAQPTCSQPSCKSNYGKLVVKGDIAVSMKSDGRKWAL